MPNLLAFFTAALAVIILAAIGLLPLWVALCLVALFAAAAAVDALIFNRRTAAVHTTRGGDDADSALPAQRALLSVLPDPCVLMDEQGVVLYQNERAGDALGPMPVGRKLSAFLRAPELTEALAQVIATGETAQLDYVERVPVDRRFDAVIAPWRYETAAGVAQGLVLVLHDLTSQERIEQMRADFVANASHELRTPLASLTGFIETLQGPAKNDPASRDRFLEIMRQQARRMSRLIDDLLSLSRIEINAHVRPDTKVELNEVMRAVADTMKPLATEAGVALELAMPDVPVRVRGDRDQLVQVMQNLTENAIKYGATGKRAQLSLRLQEQAGARPMAVMSVRDFGPGIAREHLPRLTERFYRADVASSREKGGTGLGLAIVKHIVNRHRGTLSIESKPGEGARFSVAIEAVSPHNA